VKTLPTCVPWHLTFFHALVTNCLFQTRFCVRNPPLRPVQFDFFCDDISSRPETKQSGEQPVSRPPSNTGIGADRGRQTRCVPSPQQRTSLANCRIRLTTSFGIADRLNILGWRSPRFVTSPLLLGFHFLCFSINDKTKRRFAAWTNPAGAGFGNTKPNLSLTIGAAANQQLIAGFFFSLIQNFEPL